MFNEETFHLYKDVTEFDGVIDSISPYLGGGKFCDDSVTLYVQLKNNEIIHNVKFIGEISPLGRACMNYLITTYLGKESREVVGLDEDEFLSKSFVPPHRSKQFLFSLIHFKNAILEATKSEMEGSNDG